MGQGRGARERAATQRGPRGLHRDCHVCAYRTGDSPDRPGLADPGGPRSMGAVAGRPAQGARAKRQVLRRARRTLAGTDAGNTVGAAVHVSRTAASGRRRPGVVARRWRRLDGVGRAAARRTGRSAGPRQVGRPGRRAGTAGGGRVRRRRAGHPPDGPQGPDGRRGPPARPGPALRRGPGGSLP